MKLSKLFFVALIAVAFAFLGCTPPPSINLCEKTTDCLANSAGDWACEVDGATAKITLIEMDATDTMPAMLAMNVIGTAPAADTAYKLIYYPDPWPGLGLSCLGDFLSDADGNIAGNAAYVGPDITDAKIWLIPAADVTCSDFTAVPPVLGQVNAWTCGTLFEATADDLVTYPAPDPVPAP